MATPKRVPQLPEVESRIRQLVEPFTVTLAQIVGGKTTPLPMFSRAPDAMAGKDFSKDELLNIAPGVLEWAGGGQFVVTAVDLEGQQVQFQIWWDPAIYPAKVPPPLAGSMRQPLPSQAQQAPQPQFAAPPPNVIPFQQPAAPPPSPPQMIQQPVAMAAGGGMPQMSAPYPTWDHVQPGYPTQRVSMPASPYGSTYQSPYPQPSYSSPAPALSLVDTPRREDDRTRAAEELAQREREARLALEAKIERDRIESAYNAKIAALTDELRRLSEKPTTPTIDPNIERMLADTREELRQLREEKKAEAQQSGFAQVLSVMMQGMQQSQQQMMALITAMNSKPGMDPMVQLMLENQRADRTAQLERERLDREREREQRERERERDRERERSMIGPREFIDMTDKLRSSSGVDVVLRQMSEVTGTMFSMMKNQVEMMQSIAGGGQPNPLVEALQVVAPSIQEMAKSYANMKAQVATAEAQARAFEARARNPEAFPVPPQAAQAAQAAQGDNVVPLRPGAARPVNGDGQASQPAGTQPAPVDGAPPQAAGVNDWGTDLERKLFGIQAVFVEVEKLRALVANGQISAAQAVEWVRFAHRTITAQGARKFVRVLDLYDQQIFDDFVRALVPNAPQAFIQEFVTLLVKASTNPNAPIVDRPLAQPSMPTLPEQHAAQATSPVEEEEENEPGEESEDE